MRDGTEDLQALTARLSRGERPRLVARLTRIFGPAHLSLAEDAVQEAFVSALESWDARGVPEHPAAWLLTVARNRALDRLRRGALFAALEPKVAGWATALQERTQPGDGGPLGDDELSMIALCCHPQLPEEARLALTLKVACGFSVEEIGRALLANAETIAQRIVRAKARIRDLDLSLDMPTARAMQERMPSVLRTIYLLFNEGYSASVGETLIRHEICTEAVRLAETVARHPSARTAEAHALAALLCFQHSRHAARVGADGTPILLAEQNRAYWDQGLIAQGFEHLSRARAGDVLTALHIEAGAASVHAAARSWAETDWAQLKSYYDMLMEVAPSPVVSLNRAIAVAMVDGPDAALSGIEHLARDPLVAKYVPFHMTTGDLELQRGRRGVARAAFETALGLPTSEAERRFIQRKIAACADA
ncbi:MAG: RNA polymerase subunit sigma [Alphaproteobacteria bacterium]|nr:RNA polymerase subunit sigma [Alphaproteobacteria bacterium]